VEQQLPVGPFRAVGGLAQLGHGGRVQQMVKRLPCLLHLLAYNLSIHFMTSIPKSSYPESILRPWRSEASGRSGWDVLDCSESYKRRVDGLYGSGAAVDGDELPGLQSCGGVAGADDGWNAVLPGDQ
jgi:hypothetical protein